MFISQDLGLCCRRDVEGAMGGDREVWRLSMRENLVEREKFVGERKEKILIPVLFIIINYLHCFIFIFIEIGFYGQFKLI